jgi:uncharacterized protein YneF (UPF0154 family)
MKATTKIILISGIAILLIVGAIGGLFITDKMATEGFLKDFNMMNSHYKQALFQTGQGNREIAMLEYTAFMSSLSDFQTRYRDDRPRALQGDTMFNTDMEKALQTAADAKTDVEQGDLSRAHTTLEGVRPIFNELLRRNGLSSLSVSLVDFHDSMERVIDAGDKKDAASVLERYADADEKLRAIETELNDTGVQDIRAQLEAVHRLATAGAVEQLPAQSSKLKASYVKVYLAQG